MPTPAERKALMFVAAVATLGVLARGYRLMHESGPAPAAARALGRQIAAVDSAVAAASTARASRSRGKRGNSSKGGNASKGRNSSKSGSSSKSGNARSASARPTPSPARSATSAAPPPMSGMLQAEERRLAVERSNADARRRVAERSALRTAQPQQPPPKHVVRDLKVDPVDLDTAPATDIATVPGIGPAIARRIVDDRATRGPFGSLTGLQRVKGIGPVLARKIARFVTFSRPLSAPPEVIRFRRPM